MALDPHEGTGFRGHLSVDAVISLGYNPTKKEEPFFTEQLYFRRAELLVGDNQVIPFLEQTVFGYEYVKFGKMLGIEMPITPTMRTKINKEKMDLFHKIRAAESSMVGLTKTRDGSVDDVYVDKIAAALSYNGAIGESRGSLAGALAAAKERGYHLDSTIIEVKVDDGAVLHTNMGTFITAKLEKYKSLLKSAA